MLAENGNQHKTLDFLECHGGWHYVGWRIGDQVVVREITADEFARLHEAHAADCTDGPADLPVHGMWFYRPQAETATQWADVMNEERGL
jgi:hypothetical protein